MKRAKETKCGRHDRDDYIEDEQYFRRKERKRFDKENEIELK